VVFTHRPESLRCVQLCRDKLPRGFYLCMFPEVSVIPFFPPSHPTYVLILAQARPRIFSVLFTGVKVAVLAFSVWIRLVEAIFPPLLFFSLCGLSTTLTFLPSIPQREGNKQNTPTAQRPHGDQHGTPEVLFWIPFTSAPLLGSPFLSDPKLLYFFCSCGICEGGG